LQDRSREQDRIRKVHRAQQNMGTNAAPALLFNQAQLPLHPAWMHGAARLPVAYINTSMHIALSPGAESAMPARPSCHTDCCINASAVQLAGCSMHCCQITAQYMPHNTLNQIASCAHMHASSTGSKVQTHASPPGYHPVQNSTSPSQEAACQALP
jgi:hypothetical protein